MALGVLRALSVSLVLRSPFLICFFLQNFRNSYALSMRKWRNWQTHHLEGVAPKRHAGSSPAFRTLPHEKTPVFTGVFLCGDFWSTLISTLESPAFCPAFHTREHKCRCSCRFFLMLLFMNTLVSALGSPAFCRLRAPKLC